MKNQPLAVQIWMVFAGITLGTSLLLMALIPWTLRHFFTEEIYTTIESAQKVILEEGWYPGMAGNGEPFTERDRQRQNNRTVNHMIILGNGQVHSHGPLPPEFVREAQREALGQEADISHYIKTIGSANIFYVIRRGELADQQVYLFSYMWDSYRDDLVGALFKQLIAIMAAVFLLSWIPAIMLAKYLSRPMVVLEKHVKRISSRNWHDPIALDRKDEIGKLAQSIERMRETLAKQDEAQQSLLQNISHDLKTPVMVIRSYVQSIQDGIYPKGDLSSALQVIEQESEILEHRIRDLLYLTKLDYFATREPAHESIELKPLIESAVDRHRWSRPELHWQLELQPIIMQGDLEQWQRAMDNLLENQIRYALTQIQVTLHEESLSALIRIWNDGPAIESEMIDTLFQKFQKGYKGEVGLGLAIVKRIVSLHRSTIWAANEEGGVAFYIRIPL